MMMKYMIPILILVIPLSSKAGDFTQTSAGLYASCAQWTTVNEIEHSKGFQFILKEDDSMSLDISYHTGTSKCEGRGEPLLHIENFVVEKKEGYGRKVFLLLARDTDGGKYYEIMFSDNRAIIHISDRLPFKRDLNHTLFLRKMP
jgi:hypothetical protein